MEPVEAAGKNLLREAITFRIPIVVHAAEHRLDLQPRHMAKIIGQIARFICLETLRSRATRSNRKKFRADIDEAPKENLLPFQLRPETRHGVKQRARQAA